MMDLEGIMLSEFSQKKTNTIRSHLCTDSSNKTNKLIDRLVDIDSQVQVGGCRRLGRGGCEIGEQGQEILTSS